MSLSWQVRSMPMAAAAAPEPAAGPAAADPAGPAAAVLPGRLVLQDEGGAQVTLDVYATGRRSPLARVAVRREILALYALDLLSASLRPITARGAAGTAEKKGAPQRRP